MRFYRYIIICFMVLCIPTIEVDAMDEIDSDYYNDFDYGQIQSVIDDLFPTQEKIDFGEYVKGLVTGQKDVSLESIMKDFKSTIVTQFKNEIGTMIPLLSVAIKFLYYIYSTIYINYK